MLNLKQAFAEDIGAGIEAAQEAGDLPKGKVSPVVVNHEEDEEHGDYASPVALALTKIMNKPPMDIVEAIVKHMPKKEYVGKLEAAEPGFLNIRLNPGWMVARLDDVIEEDLCGQIDIGRQRLVNLEFISANPTGPLTLGNVRPAFSADTLGNVLECAGYNVTCEYYVNDAGGQIRKLGESVVRRILQLQGQKVEYPDELYQGEYIKEVAQVVAERWREDEHKTFSQDDLKSEEILDRVSRQAAALLHQRNKDMIEKVLRIHFDVWTSERALRGSGEIERTLERLRKGGHTYKKDGAEYLRTTKYGDSEDRVLVKKDGEYAYIAPDIGYHQNKYDRKFDLLFTFVGADHQGHAPKVRAAMQALGNDVSKLHFQVVQFVRFLREGRSVKLSKRAGEIVTPEDLIKEVGLDAARFFLISHSLQSHMDFDLDLAVERSERNPVYYVQYAHVRLQSILRRAKEEGVIAEVGEKIHLTSAAPLTHTFEIQLMKAIYRWPEVVSDIATTFAVHQLATYATDLAKAVHVFYKHVPVLAAAEANLQLGRLQLVLAAKKIIAQTLDLLGVSKPDVM